MLASGLESPGAAEAPTAFRFAFLTDFHLMPGDGGRSAAGIAQCLEHPKTIDPAPDFIIAGGDLVHDSRHMTVPQAEAGFGQFLGIWNDHTVLPTHWVIGNHDLVGVNNPAANPADGHYGTGLFTDRLQLPQLFYSFDWKGWHFVVLDDVKLQPDHTYRGELLADELAFLRADLDAHAAMPTIVSAHIPTVSALPLSMYLAKAADVAFNFPDPSHLVCVNGNEVFADFPKHNVRAVLAGHLHHYESVGMNGVRFINSGAVCGNYWKGPMLDCPPGYGLADVGVDGSFRYHYHAYEAKPA